MHFEEAKKRALALVRHADSLFDTDIAGNPLNFGKVRGYVGGLATTQRFQSGRVQYGLSFNPQVLQKYPEFFIEDILPHEVAHLVFYARHGVPKKRGDYSQHGSIWRDYCVRLGGTGKRGHTLDLEPARKVSRYVYHVPAHGPLVVSAIRHNKMQRGARYVLNNGLELGKEHYLKPCNNS